MKSSASVRCTAADRCMRCHCSRVEGVGRGWEDLTLEPELGGWIRVHQTFKEAGRAYEEVKIAFANAEVRCPGPVWGVWRATRNRSVEAVEVTKEDAGKVGRAWGSMRHLPFFSKSCPSLPLLPPQMQAHQLQFHYPYPLVHGPWRVLNPQAEHYTTCLARSTGRAPHVSMGAPLAETVAGRFTASMTVARICLTEWMINPE